jgi:hypothetical protein
VDFLWRKEMKKLLIIGLLVPVVLAAKGDKWEKMRTQEGVALYSKTITGFKFKAFKGIGRVKGTLEACRKIMNDVASYPKWMSSCMHTKEVLTRGKRDFYYYIISDSPWPVADRDGIYHVKEEIFKDKLVYTHTAISRKDLVPLKKGIVRMDTARVFWIFKKKGDYIYCSYDIHSNPGGNIPISLYNGTGVDIPFKNVKALKKRIKDLSH